ncbi:uncharacterized protein LOC135285098 [Passer domesticus]|uniref:uncharacterized protein LOC135285098 n=1 Tax=Passer domesticus TaxID=48849 RepID=UPI0030FED3E7
METPWGKVLEILESMGICPGTRGWIWLWRTPGQCHTFIPYDPKSLPAPGCGAGSGFGRDWVNPMPSFQVILNLHLYQDLGLDLTLEDTRTILTIPSFQVFPNPCQHWNVGLDPSLENTRTIPLFHVIPNLHLHWNVELDLASKDTRTIPLFHVIPNPSLNQDLELDLALKETGTTPHLHPGQSRVFIPCDPKSPPALKCGAGSAFGDWDNPFIPGVPKTLPPLGCGPGLVFGEHQDNPFIPRDPKSPPALECGAGSGFKGHQDSPFIPRDPKSLSEPGSGAGSAFGDWDNPFIPGVPKTLPPLGCGAGSVFGRDQDNPTPPFQVIPNLHRYRDVRLDRSLKDTRKFPLLHSGQSQAFLPADPKSQPAPGSGSSGLGKQGI